MEHDLNAFMDKEEDAERDMEEGAEDAGGLVEVLERHASDIESLCDDLDHECLMDPEKEMGMEDSAILMTGLTELDEELVNALKSEGEIDKDRARDIAMELLQMGAIEDGARFAGFLQRASKVLGGTGGDAEDDEEDLDFESMSDDDLDAYIEG